MSVAYHPSFLRSYSTHPHTIPSHTVDTRARVCDAGPSMMTISEDKELLSDHRSQAFERCWFREMNSMGTGYQWCYQIRFADGTLRTIRGLV